MNRYTAAYIGMGGNLNNPLAQLQRALISISHLKRVSHLACSPFYRSKAIGPGNQPDYINAVVRVETPLPPLNLLSELQAIENRQGRQRHTRWGARTLDLDLLLYGETCMDGERLTLPHPRMYSRNFVLFPLYDIAPHLVFPNGVSLSALMEACSVNGLQKLERQPATETVTATIGLETAMSDLFRETKSDKKG